jgi:hypothetical protein
MNFFLTQVYFGFKFCPSVLEIVGLRVPARYIRDFALLNFCSPSKNCPSARCASAANVVYEDVDVFGVGNVCINQLLQNAIAVIIIIIITIFNNIIVIIIIILITSFCLFVCLLVLFTFDWALLYYYLHVHCAVYVIGLTAVDSTRK